MTKGGVHTLDPETRAVHDEIAKRLVQFRKELGMSRYDLAAALGITWQQIAKYERGQNRIPAARLYMIAKAMRLPIEMFYPEAKAQKQNKPYNTCVCT